MGKTIIKWISHAGFQITSRTGKIVYIDPWFDNPIGGFSLDDVKGATLVLVTHDHFDHVGQAPEIVKKTGGLLVANVETGRRLQRSLEERPSVHGVHLAGIIVQTFPRVNRPRQGRRLLSPGLSGNVARERNERWPKKSRTPPPSGRR